MKKFFKGIGQYFANFGTAVAKGDLWTRLSLVIMGMGYFGRKQIVKGILMTLIEIGFFMFTFQFSLTYLAKLGTLGTVQREEIFDPLTLSKTVNDYDNSLLILLCSIIGILFIVAFVVSVKFVFGTLSNVTALNIINFFKNFKFIIKYQFPSKY